MAAPRESVSLTPAAFFAAVRKGKRFPLLLLRGNEDYLLRQAVERVYCGRARSGRRRTSILTNSAARMSSVETLWNALTTLPLLAASRMVVLELSGEPKKELAEVIKRYAARPSATTQF